MANRLIDEQSPYLLQHAHNPVDWYPWGEEPFKRAKTENKPVLVSIGYAACHWCHVMERESFENEEVAAYMNEHFINIKVDREEHPAVDHMYMDAIQAISGSGGWPLNAFVTPDKVPFYGGTYYPPTPLYNRPSWIQLLQRMNEIWHKQPEEVATQTNQMLQYLQQASKAATAGQGTAWDKDTCKQMAENLLKQADKRHGGFGNAPKFPGTMAISFLLEHYHYTGNEEAEKHALHSLDAMIEGGIYDQAGGGFARYSTDAEWLAPHFEKMLYDNALLVSSLCDAWQVSGNERYKEVIEETIAFAERELKSPEGVYYSALDADSEGVEGKFYTWTWDEWLHIAEADDPATTYFGILPEGNWEHTNILHVAKSISEVAAMHKISEEELQKQLLIVKQKVMDARSKRVRPQTDDKSLLSWNALMNIAMAKAATALRNDRFLQRAEAHMDAMLNAFEEGGELMHVWKNGKAKIPANIDDYAYLINALLQLASANGNNELIRKADALTQKCIQNFADEGENFFYYTSKQHTDIPVRKIDLYDGATPSANAVMAQNIFLLSMVMEHNKYAEQALYMLHQMSTTALRYTYSFAFWSMLLQRYAWGPKTIVFTGDNSEINVKALQQVFLPGVYAIHSGKESPSLPINNGKDFKNETLIFVCTPEACLPPVKEINEAVRLVKGESNV